MRRGISTALVLGVALSAFVAGSAGATPITYIFQGTASGSLDGVPFTDLEFTFTFHGDTENLFHNLLAYVNPDEIAPSTIALAGHPVATVLSDTSVFGGAPSGVAGFTSSGDIFVLGTAPTPLPELADYHLDTPIGPLVAPVSALLSHGGTLETDLGTLVLSSFSATGSFQAVPEPALLPLLAGGLGAALARRVRRPPSERSPIAR